MSIVAIVKEALRIARTHKSLWLFGFLVGVGGGVNFGGGGGGEAIPPAAAAPPELGTVLLVALAVVVCLAAFILLKFLSAGALIEGVKRARRNGAMTLREGFRQGWAHWGVLFRIALLYALVSFLSVAPLVGVSYLVWRTLGSPAVFVAGAFAVLVGVPWLLTLAIWQAFAERIAVFENRRALDAMRKARLFLHGRLQLGLKLLVAAFLGVLLVGAIGFAVIGPVVAIVVASAGVWGALGAAGLAVLTLLPLLFVAFAILGIVNSSVWTIGYLSQVER